MWPGVQASDYNMFFSTQTLKTAETVPPPGLAATTTCLREDYRRGEQNSIWSDLQRPAPAAVDGGTVEESLVDYRLVALTALRR